MYSDLVRNFYNSRTDYDNIATVTRASLLVNLYPPQSGSQIVDLAAGTGNVAFRAAEIAGLSGSVVGYDIAEELLKVAREKGQSLDLSRVGFQVADVGQYHFAERSFDVAYCSFAIMLIDDVDGFLDRIREGLRPGGFFAFTSASEDSYLNPWIVEAGRRAGVRIPPTNERFGSPERIASRLARSGFGPPEIHEVQLGKFLGGAAAKAKWDGKFWLHPEQTLEHVSPEVAARMKVSFDAIVDQESGDGGVWFEEKVYYVRAFRT